MVSVNFFFDANVFNQNLRLEFVSSSPFREQEEVKVFECDFTLHETWYLQYIAQSIVDVYINRAGQLYIDHQYDEGKFNEYLIKTYSDIYSEIVQETNAVSDEEKSFHQKKIATLTIKVADIVASIWEKTKTKVNKLIEISENQQIMAQEKESQAVAHKRMQKYRENGKPGHVFTRRQVDLLKDHLMVLKGDLILCSLSSDSISFTRNSSNSDEI